MPDSTPSLRAYPPVRSFEVEVSEMDTPNARPADEILAEMRALNAAGQAVECKSTMTEARSIVANVFASRANTASNIDGLLISAAMAKIIGEDVKPFLVEMPRSGPWDRIVLETIAHAWTRCVAGHPEVAIELLPKLRARQHEEESPPRGRPDAVNLMAMYYWMSAVEALANGNRVEAERLWRRALEVGAHFGTDSHLLVSWTFAATFFPTD